MEAYKEWVRHNRQWISSIESLASTATWFLPERFANYELASEAVSTLLGLVTVMNQHIVETAPSPPPHNGRGVTHPTLAVLPEHDQGVPWALCVSVMKEVEVLTEMAAENYLGKDQKWGPVASVEAIKALLRLLILRKSGFKLVLDGGETKNTEDYIRGSEHFSPDGSRRILRRQGMPQGPVYEASGPSRPNINSDFYPRDLEGRAMQAMQKFGAHSTGSNRPSWVRQRPSPQELRPVEQERYIPRPIPTALKREPAYRTRGFLAGEVLLISRPLLYVLFVWRYGLKSWRPWLSALSVDLIGMYLISDATYQADRRLALERSPDTQQVNASSLSARERQELRRRKLLLALYIMRNPFFDRYTRRPLEAVESFCPRYQ